MNYKFTSDGRKVVIVGALNAKETIVQEVFVSDGTEFPAGEHFVVKTLLDVPAETYQSRQKRQAEEYVAKLKRECERLKAEISGFRFATAAASSKITWIRQINDPEVNRVFKHIKAVLCGDYTHVVFNDYNGLEIKEWDAELFSRSDGYGENRRFDGIRLVSLFGVWNNRLELDWRVHSYSDGSGSGSSHFTPCKSLQDAVDYCAKTINAKDYISDKDVEFCTKYGIAFDEVKNAERIREKRECKINEIAQKREQLAKLESDLVSL